jgi:hypothetical protein
MLAAIIFIITYTGVALGRIPGLVIDRVGIALLGAIGMIVCGVITTDAAVKSIDLPTILLLYSLMIIAAQLRLGGFYTWAALKMTLLLDRPKTFLLITMLASAFLSAVFGQRHCLFRFHSSFSAGLDPDRHQPAAIFYWIGRLKQHRFCGDQGKKGQIFEFDILWIWIRMRSNCFFNLLFEFILAFRRTRFWLTVL